MTHELPSGAGELTPKSEHAALMKAATADIDDEDARGWVQFFDDPTAYAPVDEDCAVDAPIELPLEPGPPALGPRIIDIEGTTISTTEQP
jgi:hypothetical protein